jgi:hypothetical protein
MPAVEYPFFTVGVDPGCRRLMLSPRGDVGGKLI